MFRCRFLLAVLVLSLWLGMPPGACLCGETTSVPSPSSEEPVPYRYGLALLCANTYKPVNDIGLVMATGVALFDYERVWHHKAPEPLRFKVEVSAGSAVRDKSGFVGSANILALYYLGKPAFFRPYVEGGQIKEKNKKGKQ